MTKPRANTIILALLAVAMTAIAATTQINLATQVKGLLAIANGGTGTAGANSGILVPAATLNDSTGPVLTNDAGLVGDSGLRVQTATNNSYSGIAVMPSGTDAESFMRYYNSSSSTNTGLFQIDLNGSQVLFESSHYGTGTAPTNISVSGLGFSVASLTSGDCVQAGTGGLLTTTVGPCNSFGSEPANEVYASPNGSSGTPGFRALVGADIPAINLAGTGNGGITGSLPIGNLAPGSNGQCAITSASASTWGSCAGTAGVQTLSAAAGNPLASVSASTTSTQTIGSGYTFSSGQVNSVGKSFRISASGRYNNGSGGSETVDLYLIIGSTDLNLSGAVVPNLDGMQWAATITCTVYTASSNDTMMCNAVGVMQDPVPSSVFNGNCDYVVIVNSSLSFNVAAGVSFSVASTSNVANLDLFDVEQLN